MATGKSILRKSRPQHGEKNLYYEKCCPSVGTVSTSEPGSPESSSSSSSVVAHDFDIVDRDFMGILQGPQHPTLPSWSSLSPPFHESPSELIVQPINRGTGRSIRFGTVTTHEFDEKKPACGRLFRIHNHNREHPTTTTPNANPSRWECSNQGAHRTGRRGSFMPPLPRRRSSNVTHDQEIDANTTGKSERVTPSPPHVKVSAFASDQQQSSDGMGKRRGSLLPSRPRRRSSVDDDDQQGGTNVTDTKRRSFMPFIPQRQSSILVMNDRQVDRIEIKERGSFLAFWPRRRKSSFVHDVQGYNVETNVFPPQLPRRRPTIDVGDDDNALMHNSMRAAASAFSD